MILGDLSADAFLKRYWQQKPLLIRHALADYRSPISGDELAGLALESEVESRLVESLGGDWTLKHGPFTEEDFLGLPDEDWTLLVQGVDLWVPRYRRCSRSSLLYRLGAWTMSWSASPVREVVSALISTSTMCFCSKSKARGGGRLAQHAPAGRRCVTTVLCVF